MHSKSMTAIGILTLALIAGCNNAKSPDAVANDVAAAQHKTAQEIADAQKEAAKDAATATEKVDEKTKDLNNVQATGAYDVSMAKAEGTHKIALDQCAALSGDAQSKCKDVADADYAAAKANAKATEVTTKQ
jgi:hypothetical protein